jgi:hypothetical protein
MILVTLGSVALAQGADIEQFIGGEVLGIVNGIIKLLIAVATLVFIFGISSYPWNLGCCYIPYHRTWVRYYRSIKLTHL